MPARTLTAILMESIERVRSATFASNQLSLLLVSNVRPGSTWNKLHKRLMSASHVVLAKALQLPAPMLAAIALLVRQADTAQRLTLLASTVLLVNTSRKQLSPAMYASLVLLVKA